MFACCCCEGHSNNDVTQQLQAMPVLQSGSWAHSSRRSDGDEVSWRAKEFDIQNSPGKGPHSAPVVAVTFEKPDGDVVVVELNQRPLGMRFTGTGPMVVTAVHEKMQAAERGIEVNWRVTHIDDKDVRDMWDDAVRRAFMAKCSKLRLM
uniref:PDZ domain-containing protein n=1 Tax=Noctiluca scintillans TaxID=2966 RepID=A0A7S1AGS9_NOCSC|mmetsp:Transcript_44104/g.116671  ORF Transcript_44104/g.116671 Transcript_44104/m.116671 type:complete len:149 (+) Transcript_44104:97-543(+)